MKLGIFFEGMPLPSHHWMELLRVNSRGYDAEIGRKFNGCT